jgi:transposase InsO family protein
VLAVIDSFTRECLVMKVAQSLPAHAVTDALEEVIAARGIPQAIQVDNGSEFTSNHFDAWAYLRGAQIDFVRAGKPVENAFIGSSIGAAPRCRPRRVIRTGSRETLPRRGHPTNSRNHQIASGVIPNNLLREPIGYLPVLI